MITYTITEFNKLIYVGTILVSNKIGVPLRNANRNAKPDGRFDLKDR